MNHDFIRILIDVLGLRKVRSVFRECLERSDNTEYSSGSNRKERKLSQISPETEDRGSLGSIEESYYVLEAEVRVGYVPVRYVAI